MTQFAFFQGKIVPIEQANVSIMNHTFNYGTGCFEGIRAYWNAEEEQLLVFRMPEHYRRLVDSATFLEIKIPHTIEEIGQWTLELLRCEAFRMDVYIRPVAYKDDSGIGCRLHNLKPGLAIFGVPFGLYMENDEGARVGVSSWRRSPDSSIPSRGKINGAYVNSALSRTWAYKHGYDEAIVLNEAGSAAEGSAENLWMQRRGQLVTPPITEDILEGITRDTVIQLARQELGIEVVERPIDRSELYVADELFYTGTGVQIGAIISVDGLPVGSGVMGPLVRQLRELYFNVVRGKIPRYRSWCTPVY